MKKELKQYINDSYTAPKPLQKEVFLSTLNFPKTRRYDFYISQFSYVRKRTWVLSLLLYLAAYLIAIKLPIKQFELLWIVSAFLPFLAMMTVTETIRSSVYGLSELEMTTRYSLISVLLARIILLGAGNLLFLVLGTPFLAGNVDLSMLRTGVYLLVPYLLTGFCSYSIVNRIRSSEVNYYCAGIAALVSSCGLFFGRTWYVIYEQQYFIIWLAALLLLIVAVIRQIHKLILNAEDFIWNSYSTV